MTRARIHIVVAEPSVIIRSGLTSVLKRLNSLNIDIAEISDMSLLSMQLLRYKPNILIIEPSLLGTFSLQIIKKEIAGLNLKIIAFQNTLVDASILKHYDAVISNFDNIETIQAKIIELVAIEDNTPVKQEVSSREKEIIVCIVKGMTNKQIADNLNLSTHTIMTHRRNISNKLQIHSSAGLTIYAIVNKLVDINDIKDSIEIKE